MYGDSFLFLGLDRANALESSLCLKNFLEKPLTTDAKEGICPISFSLEVNHVRDY